MNILNSFFKFIKKHKIFTGIFICIFLLFLILIFVFSSPADPEYITTPVSKGNLQQIVESVGSVVSERDLILQFPKNGLVSEVFVNEGDKVKSGDTLAKLRAGELLANINSYKARADSAAAELKALEEGSRPEDIAVSEAELEQKKTSLEIAKTSLKTAEQNLQRSLNKLEALKRESEISLEGEISYAGITAAKQLSAARSALGAIKDILERNTVQRSLSGESYGGYISYRDALRRIELSLDNSTYNIPNPRNFSEALISLQNARSLCLQAAEFTQRLYTQVSNLPETTYLTKTQKETEKTNISAELAQLQGALSNIDSGIKTLKDSAANFDTLIQTEEAAVTAAKGEKEHSLADIANYEAAISIARAQLNLIKAGNRPADIDAARARLRQAQADLQRVQSEYSDTILKAPVAGTITKVNIKPGEFTPGGGVISMLGISPYRVEIFVSEVDIPKVKLNQNGFIELEAFPGTQYDLTVSEIDPAATDIEGISKYRVVLDFVYDHDNFKIGMTGDATIVTNFKENILYIPGRAVLENENNREYVRVLNEKNKMTEIIIESGMEGEDGFIEIINGLKGDEIIIELIKN